MKLLAIDGNSLLNRAFFGVRLLTARDGTYTNAIFGFLNILLKLEREYQPDGVAVAFDVSRKTFRHEQYEAYKANRKGMPEELAVQLPLIKEILSALGYPILTCEGFEGDDILGTVSRRCMARGDTCVIASGDRDILQLVTEQVSVSLAKTKEDLLYTPETFRAEYGFDAIHIVDMKALMGDSSDNIPGVKGIGEKTARSLIQSCGDIETIYAGLESLEVTPRVKKLLADGKEQAVLSKQLATIVLDAPLAEPETGYIRGPVDGPVLTALLERLDLFSFFEKFGLDPAGISGQGSAPASQEKRHCEIAAGNVLEQWKNALEGAKEVFLLLGEETLQVQAEGRIYAIPPFDQDAALRSLFQSGVPIYTVMAKPLYKLGWKMGFGDLPIVFDAELAAYLLNASSKGYSLAGLCAHYLPQVRYEVEEAYQEIAAFPALCQRLSEEMEAQEMGRLYREIELPLCPVLADMEVLGFAVDRGGVTRFGEELDRETELVREQIFRLAGQEFNINSTRELGQILFDQLKLPAKKKTKTGYSTSAEVLEGLMEKHEIVPLILEYRKLTKLSSTYVTGLLKVMAEDGRVHSTFNQTETRTGRISSAEPNVQNIPVRTRLGAEMRRFFVAKEGYTLVDADYSQIELRILAHIAQDQQMIRAFRENADIHAITASQVFGCPLESLPAELRSRAKAINFGIVYGIGAFSLSKQIHVSVAEAKAYIDAYLRTYSGVARYQKQAVEQAREDGYAVTIYGRRRELADIHSKNKQVQAFAERVALNMPVQGTAADIIKLAMIRVRDRIRREGLDARLILQVHDELIVEAREEIAPQVEALLREEMERAASLEVPLETDVHTGMNWYLAKG